jgi:hypothetical protein
MKKSLSTILAIALFVSFISCKEKKKTDSEQVSSTEKFFVVEPKTTTINWIAYKTTDKVPVKGQFTKLKIDNPIKGKTALDALNNLQFSIPVSSLFTKDTIRDGKLKKFFFGVMDNTELISGTIHINNETSGSVDLEMNGVSQVLPITFFTSDQMITIEAVMDLDNWNAQNALVSLNEACKELHTGTDGVTKTWSEVKIEIATYLKYE